MALDKLNSDMITDGTIVDADVSGIAASKLTGALPATIAAESILSSVILLDLIFVIAISYLHPLV
jgi:hypothetical protein